MSTPVCTFHGHPITLESLSNESIPDRVLWSVPGASEALKRLFAAKPKPPPKPRPKPRPRPWG